ncbi:MAG: RNA-binding transcriptional accessory protein [Galactobacillus timonensis]|uniref:Tex family protein n=1 Tax=Galactobacillus timonensis TaxID=2041840 RepID=UPI0023EF8E94|nr:Tex family protein [Galactobacillus timonensis]MCI6066691.1 RNA-binding transcriptional accessory protein [Galactobacillus timonensis]MCI6754969.1 RNA-binding transcriptional accessory protein [Galactobacillus timonensis]MDD7086794.1 Tex family protein [Galactobacillus timonensis]MDY5223000.1 Tex family protein [Lachnospiraceae bacterium]
MNEEIIQALAKDLKISADQVRSVLSMLEEGNTVPFIARYRKEQTKNLDEEQILAIQKQYQYEVNLADRKAAVLDLIAQQGKLTDEIKNAINACTKLSQVEDLYKPYKQKKKTRAAVAIKNGLQPLADWMLALPAEGDVLVEAAKYVGENVPDAAAALQGAQDIIAENVSDNAKLRWAFKDAIVKNGVIVTKLKKDAVDEKKIYEMYYDRSERVSQIADHRVMAIDRAEKEKVITVSFTYDLEGMENEAIRTYTKEGTCVCQKELETAIKDGMERLLMPSIENEVRSDLSERAHNKSIEIFAKNLEQLLSQPALKGRVVLGFDPGYYNGCKLAVIDATGKLLQADKIYPFKNSSKVDASAIEASKRKVLTLINKWHVQTIAIGNGTASRESERFCAELIQENHLNTTYAIVSEAGASVWSAQEEAREEFPDLAIEERSAVSIARRLLDPLPELIKIDPKSIGVGQYQHDLPQKALSERLDEAVMKVVNRVGADLNTASVDLLSHISGLNAGIAKEIVNYRNSNGRFTNRKQLLDVKKLGPKAFTQCAGFLRIIDGDEPLDETSIHPESYKAAREVMQACNITKLGEADALFPDDKVKDLGIDPYTLKDIEDAIRQPLRDYRDQFKAPILKSNVLELSDLHVGDELDGTVRNVTAFGAFVDIGLHEDGLVHVSHMSMNRISDPSEVVSVGDIVHVYVLEIDEAKQRIALSLLPKDKLDARDAAWAKQRENYRKNGKNNRGNNRNNRNNRSNKPEKKQVTMEDATAALLARFGSKH